MLTADATGAATGDVSIPSDATLGAQTVKFAGAKGDSATTSVTVTASTTQTSFPPITVAPSSTTPGATITVSGAGCTPVAGIGANVQVDVVNESDSDADEHTQDIAGKTFAVNPDGTWSIVLTISSSAPLGSYDVLASCLRDGAEAMAYDFAFLGVGAATATLSPATLGSGGATEATLTGFQGFEPIAVTVSGAQIATLTASMGGNGDAVLTLPSTVGVGSHQLTFTGQTSGRSATATLTVTTAAVPAMTVAPNPVAPGASIKVSGTLCLPINGGTPEVEIGVFMAHQPHHRWRRCRPSG